MWEWSEYVGLALAVLFVPLLVIAMHHRGTKPTKGPTIDELETAQLTSYPRISGRGTRANLRLVGNYSFRGYTRYEDIAIWGNACVLVEAGSDVYFDRFRCDTLVLYFLATNGEVTWNGNGFAVKNLIAKVMPSVTLRDPVLRAMGEQCTRSECGSFSSHEFAETL